MEFITNPQHWNNRNKKLQNSGLLSMACWKKIISNKFSIIIFLIVLFAICYASYRFVSKSGEPHGRDVITEFNNEVKLSPVPDNILRVAESVRISDRLLKVYVDNKHLVIKALEAKPSTKHDFVYFFLHGAAFTSQIWKTLGTLQLVAAFGQLAIAIDLPGWGHSTNSRLTSEESRKNFLTLLFNELNITKPILITPSMSGVYSMPFIMEPQSETCKERINGLIALAPTATNVYSDAQFHRCEAKTFIVIGENDKNIGLFALANLKNMPNRKIFIMKNSSHACYKDQPTYWNEIIHHYNKEIIKRADDRSSHF